eukprot:15366072-Ditylum_brightwellii.AAC.4
MWQERTQRISVQQQERKEEVQFRKVKCGRCGKEGHATKMCFDDPKNAHKRPSWYQVQKGKTRKNKEEEEEEEANMYCQEVAPVILLATPDITFPATIELLKDQIYGLPIQEQVVIALSDGVMFPDGQVKGTSMIGDIPGVIYNKNGTKLSGCRITEVKYCKDNVYNLFSLTKRQKKGWHLHGNEKAIWITKGDQKLVFDIMINTKDGHSEV